MTTPTLAELQGLTDAELNARVARWLGYKVQPSFSVFDSQRITNRWVDPYGKYVFEGLPNWAGSIGDAWELVERMTKHVVCLTKHRNGFSCGVIPLDFEDGDDGDFEVDHPTSAPRAIVIAALLAAGEVAG